MIKYSDLRLIISGNRTIKQVAKEKKVHRTTVSRHLRKYTGNTTWTIHKGKRVRYNAKKAEKAYNLRQAGETWPQVAKKVYKDKEKADHALRLAGYYKRDFVTCA